MLVVINNHPDDDASMTRSDAGQCAAAVVLAVFLLAMLTYCGFAAVLLAG